MSPRSGVRAVEERGCPPEGLLAQLASDELGPAPRAPITAHLESCEDCRAIVSALITAATPRSSPTATHWGLTTREPGPTRVDTPEAQDGPAPVALVPGTRIGRYVLERSIGLGGMSVVWRARDPKLGRDVALKLMRLSEQSDPQRERARLVREAHALARLNHPHVIPVYDAGEHDGHVFIAMELGVESLSEWLSRPRPRGEILAAFVQAGRGMAAAHAAGLVHGDFKPDNVLCGADGQFKVSDFGLARPVEAKTAELPCEPPCVGEGQRETLAAGTPRFMAPETKAGQPSTQASDQYSFCVALKQELERSDRGAPSRGLSKVLARGLADAPEGRFPSLAALFEALAPYTEQGRRRRGRAIAVGVAVLLLLLGPVVAWWARNSALAATLHPERIENGGFEAALGTRVTGWKLQGGAHADYVLTSVSAPVQSGRASGHLHAVRPPTGYATVMQVLNARSYRGQRIRATVYVKTRGVSQRGDVWLRARGVESSTEGRGLASVALELQADSEEFRAYALELEIPERATLIDYGVGIDGPGELWMDDASIELLPPL
jgi:eukaryotic-like serine/threonine-protein kinase